MSKSNSRDEQLGEYYGSMRSKYIKFMGFDYDHVKFDEIGKDLKADPAPKVFLLDFTVSFIIFFFRKSQSNRKKSS